MKRLCVLVILPAMLFALEKVNLIKNSGFERDSEEWREVTGGDSPSDTAIANSHDDEKAFAGYYSGSCDTRMVGSTGDSAVLIQGFPVVKTVSDIDSLLLDLSVIPKDNLATHTMSARIVLYIDTQTPNYQFACYFIKAPDLSVSPPSDFISLGVSDFPSDTNWHFFLKGIKTDLLGHGISADSKVDSFYVLGWGGYFPPWRGQKIFWDDIRLTGYADYDVGLKGILSGDSVWKNTGYTPTARIKNFGRKPADSFLVIAQIEGGSGVVYADTLTWSLTADTEDTLSFKEFKPSDAANYTLTVSTLMTPDESDEDDAMSKALYGTGVAEPVTPPENLVLEVSSMIPFPRVSYSLPLGQQGTISLYDPTGRKVESVRVQGSGKVEMRARLASGVYFIRLETGHSSIVRKAIVLN